ncbi:hypothetical protein [Metabacillus herbersteinensis]|uniref:hypothetical protein n=1 Tax=Metabacillus herbersteinensis TaxID=283816 RepID=UPI00366BECDB
MNYYLLNEKEVHELESILVREISVVSDKIYKQDTGLTRRSYIEKREILLRVYKTISKNPV